MFRKVVLSFLSQPGFRGVLEVTDRGRSRRFGQPVGENESLPAPQADLRVINPAFYRRVSLYGQTGFGQAYFMGDFQTSDLKRLLLWFLQNRELIPGFGGSRSTFEMINWAAGLQRLAHRLRKNTRRGSRRNIKAHYDLSNEFYELWLDSTMTYSSAVFSEETADSLQAAQENKYRLLCEKGGLGPNDHVLEIGCGWGGLAVFAARNYGCRVTATTISDAQFAYARERVNREGLGDRITLIKKDYRDLEGEYDKIVSIEMMEALGHEHVPLFMEKCRDLLKPGGKLAVQIITFPDEYFQDYLDTSDYSREYIFPGGELLSLEKTKGAAKRFGMETVSEEAIGQSYARTLGHWAKNFLAAKERVKGLGFDERFCRKWLYYLVSCEAAFEIGYIDDWQVVMRKKE